MKFCWGIRPGNSRHRALAQLLLLIVLGGSAEAVWAQRSMGPVVLGVNQTHQKPQGRQFSRQSNLSLSVDPSQTDMLVTGYVSLVIDYTAQAPLAADTTLRMVYYVSYSADSYRFRVEESWTLPAGSTRGRLRLQLPAYAIDQLAWWDVWVDGVFDNDLSQPSDQPIIIPLTSGGAVADVAPLRVLDASYQRQRNATSSAAGPAGSRDVVLADNMIATFVATEIPEDWFRLTPYDIVRIEMTDLESLESERPQAFAALIRWVHSGGNLWVDRVGGDWEELPKLTELLGWNDSERQTEPRIPTLEDPPGIGSWDALVLSPQNPAILGEEARQRDFAIESFAEAGELLESLRSLAPTLTDEWCAIRVLGWGTVGAFRDDWFETPANITGRHQELASQFWSGRSWLDRHGTNPRLANDEFSSWLIPGVGHAPVLEFQILITLFIIVIGPLNYWMLKRMRRLQLLVVTIPLVALVVTVSLLGYGLLADGWKTRVRAMSITTLNSEHRLASSWSRLSYYAAFAPGDGLEFDRDTQVYPIEPGSSEGFAQPSGAQRRSLSWVGGRQHLDQGWLASRTPTQYLVIESQPDFEGLKIARRQEELLAESPFTAPLQWVAAIDERGQWYTAEEIPGPGRFRLTATDEVEVVTTFRQLMQDHHPTIPPEMLDSPLHSRYRRRYGYWNQQAATSFDHSLLATRWDLLNGRVGYPALMLPRQTYLAVGDRKLATSLGLADAEEVGSVHLVLGDW